MPTAAVAIVAHTNAEPALMPETAPVSVTTHVGPNDDFRATALALAKAHEGKVAAWGTLRLDGSHTPYRFATIQLELEHDRMWNLGGYLIEQAPGKLWLVEFQWTGITQPFHGRDNFEDGPPTEWLELKDTAIEHGEFAHAYDRKTGRRAGWGSESTTLALRDGKLVVLASEWQVEADAGTEQRRWQCKSSCPELASYHFANDASEWHVIGPVDDVSKL
jgi:hypothetical protein